MQRPAPDTPGLSVNEPGPTLATCSTGCFAEAGWRTCRALSSGVTSGSTVDVAAPTTAPRLLRGASGKHAERNVAGSQSPAGQPRALRLPCPKHKIGATRAEVPALTCCCSPACKPHHLPGKLQGVVPGAQLNQVQHAASRCSHTAALLPCSRARPCASAPEPYSRPKGQTGWHVNAYPGRWAQGWPAAGTRKPAG